jgi:hypothetical protein
MSYTIITPGRDSVGKVAPGETLLHLKVSHFQVMVVAEVMVTEAQAERSIASIQVQL